jgi:hypothetical protein
MGPFQQAGLDAGSGQLRGKLGINDAAAAAAGLGIGLRMQCTSSVDDFRHSRSRVSFEWSINIIPGHPLLLRLCSLLACKE